MSDGIRVLVKPAVGGVRGNVGTVPGTMSDGIQVLVKPAVGDGVADHQVAWWGGHALQGAHPEVGGGGDPLWGGHDAYPDGVKPPYKDGGGYDQQGAEGCDDVQQGWCEGIDQDGVAVTSGRPPDAHLHCDVDTSHYPPDIVVVKSRKEKAVEISVVTAIVLAMVVCHGGGDPPWGGFDAHIDGLGGHAQQRESPHDSDKYLNVPRRNTFVADSDKLFDVPSDTFAVNDLEDFVKFAKKGPDIHLLKKTSSDQLELPQQGAFCLRHPEDSGGGDIVGVQIVVFPLGLATAYSCASKPVTRVGRQG